MTNATIRVNKSGHPNGHRRKNGKIKNEMVECDLDLQVENYRCVHNYDVGGRIQWRFTTRMADRGIVRRDEEQNTVYTRYTIHMLCV